MRKIAVLTSGGDGPGAQCVYPRGHARGFAARKPGFWRALGLQGPHQRRN